MTAIWQLTVGFLSIALFVFCDYTVTRWAELYHADGLWTWRLACVLVIAPIGALTFGLVGARMGLAAVSGFVNVGITAGAVLVGLTLRREHLTLSQKAGLIAAVLAIILLNFGRDGSPQNLDTSTQESR
jgi:drug/metabolite transporter (DMT)-like permease